MTDVFNEQLVKKKPSTKDTIIKAGIIAVVCILSFICLMYLAGFALIAIAAIIFGAYYAFSFFNVEYEYIFTNGELDIDCIYAKSRRKRMFSSSVKNFEIMAHVSDNDHADDFANVVETKDYSSGTVSNNTYAFVCTYKSKRTKYIFEPNDDMLKAFKTYLTPRKLIIKR